MWRPAIPAAINLRQWQRPPLQQRPQWAVHNYFRDRLKCPEAQTLATRLKVPQSLKEAAARAQTFSPRSKTLLPLTSFIKHNAKDAKTDMSATAKEVIKSKDVQKRTIHYPFWFGGSASCFAACVTHPLDLGM